MKDEQVRELLYQAYETEIGGVDVYTTALRCVENDDLKEETAGRKVVRTIGEALVQAMEIALSKGEPGAAQIVAAECVVLAETKDHENWHLLGEVSKKVKGETAKVLKDACEKVEPEEDEHLYHTRGWARELWIDSLGMKAVLPPPEEVKDVHTAIGQARAEQARSHMIGGSK